MLDHVWSCPSVVIIYIGGSVGGVKYSSWLRELLLKAVLFAMCIFNYLWEGGRRRGKRSHRKCQTCSYTHLLFVWKVIGKKRGKMA